MWQLRPTVLGTMFAVLACVTGVEGCAGGSAVRPSRPNGPPMAPAPVDVAACYVHLPNTRVTMTELGDRVVPTYTTEASNVSRLRRTVRRFSEEDAGFAPAASVPHVPSPTQTAERVPGTGAVLSGTHASISDVDDGVTLQLVPVAAPVRALLRRQVEEQRSVIPVRCPPTEIPSS
jgi:hypothetical protein